MARAPVEVLGEHAAEDQAESAATDGDGAEDPEGLAALAGSVNVVTSVLSAAGASIAPATPWIARAMTSTANDGAAPPSAAERVYGPVDAEDRLTCIETAPLSVAEQIDGTTRYEGDVRLERTGAFGYSVRVLPDNSLLASSAELGVVAVA